MNFLSSSASFKIISSQTTWRSKANASFILLIKKGHFDISVYSYLRLASKNGLLVGKF